MYDLVLPLAVMGVTIAVAGGLMLCCRHFLKLRADLAPETVYPTATSKIEPTVTQHDLRITPAVAPAPQSHAA